MLVSENRRGEFRYKVDQGICGFLRLARCEILGQRFARVVKVFDEGSYKVECGGCEAVKASGQVGRRFGVSEGRCAVLELRW